METLNVYFYSLIEAADWTMHCGLVADTSSDAVRKDIQYNYREPVYINVLHVPELEAVVDSRGNTTVVERQIEHA